MYGIRCACDAGRKVTSALRSGRFDRLIVDDVLTAGATLSEAARALDVAGADMLSAGGHRAHSVAEVGAVVLGV